MPHGSTDRCAGRILAVTHVRPRLRGDRLLPNEGRREFALFHTIDHVLSEFDARPHWGKQQYFLAPDILRERYPRWDDFVEVRRKLDPTGTFLNAPLRTLFE
ncbi:D-arabinono-1,4-lactone oxidase [Arthrobacter terricola]|uniref:D-arabinono-1,4-lactone oxidase n=1 Tax=Arthrobacter TaxID=1663 RepID=UPI002E273A6C